MVPEMGGFLKTFRCIVAALLSESTVGNLSLLTELIVHRHVHDIFCFERSAAVFKIAAFAIACHLVCRVMVDAATPCATGSFMVFLHWFELFGMKILTIVAKCCHQHERKEHHSHHDHWSNNEVAVGTTEVQNMAGHAGHLINSKLQCSQPWLAYMNETPSDSMAMKTNHNPKSVCYPNGVLDLLWNGKGGRIKTCSVKSLYFCFISSFPFRKHPKKNERFYWKKKCSSTMCTTTGI